MTKGTRKNANQKRREGNTSYISTKEIFDFSLFGDANVYDSKPWKCNPLVGFTGKVTKRKLRPLRRSRSDKIREAKLEQEFLDKCYRVERQIRYHKNLLDRMKEIPALDQQNFCEFYEELGEMHENSRKRLLFFLDDSLPTLSRDVQEMLDEILKEDSSMQNVWSNHLSKSDKADSLYYVPQYSLKYKSRGPDISKVLNDTTLVKKKESQNSVFTNSSPKWQIFVRSSLNSSLITMKVCPNELGEVIFNAVRGLMPNLADCILLYQGRKVNLNRGIAEQGIQNESNIDLHFSLRGGANENDSKNEIQDQSTLSTTKEVDPTTWNKAKVATWFEEMCAKYELENEDVEKLKLLNGAGLQSLKKEDWIRRSPNQGDLLYNLWEKLNSEQGNAAMMSSAATVKEQPSIHLPGGNTFAKEGATSNEENAGSNCKKTVSNAKSTVSGIFGAVDDLACFDSEALSVEDFAHLNPNCGEVVVVKGLCSSRPRNSGGAGSVLLRNDPHPRGDFLEVKVDIRAKSSTSLTKHTIKTFLDIKLSEVAIVCGRVEELDKNFQSQKERFVVLPLKLVIDGDDHAAFRQERKKMPSFSRQISMAWPVSCGVFPAELSTNQPLFKGEVLKKEYGLLWCAGSAPIETVKRQVVALKNCVSGDVYIGVSDNGKVCGFSVSKETLLQKREDLTKAVGSILPDVDNNVVVCDSGESANELISKGKAFVAFMWLPTKSSDCNLEMIEDDKIDIVVRIHVVKGESPINFIKQSDTHAFKRVGTEAKLVSDYEQLFQALYSLASRKLPSKDENSIPKEITKEAAENNKHSSKLRLFQKMSKQYETDTREFKAIYGKPTEIILKDYVAKYTASFLNTDGGSIYFGIYEKPKTKESYVVGIVLTTEERKALYEASSELICNFWPSVHSSQFSINFTSVKCDVEKCSVKFPKTNANHYDKSLGIVANCDQIQKLLNFIQTKVNKRATVVRLPENKFAILLEDATKINVEEFLEQVECESKKSKYFSLIGVDSEELKSSLGNLCVMCIKAMESQYPIHLTKPLKTYTIKGSGQVHEMTSDEILQRFSPNETKFDFEKFQQSVNRWEKENSSYLLITSPQHFSKKECDLYGLVIPEWFLVIDFDQTPNGEGHLFNIFKTFHDKHQPERNIFLKTPLNRKLEINSANGICWCAVRGYEEVAESMSKDGHAEWMKEHGKRIVQQLHNELVPQVNPNQLVILCLWSEGHEALVHSLDYLLQNIFALWGPTRVSFLFSNKDTKHLLSEELIERLGKAGYGEKISNDNAFVGSPQQLSRFLASRMPSPYRSEYAFQIPAKKFFLKGEEMTVLEPLPQKQRQVLKGQLEFMYSENFATSNSKKLEEIREMFYAGSEIPLEGLANNIAIKRDKMEDIKKEIKTMINDRKSRVRMIIIKAERGAGATTLCLQLLHEYHCQFPCSRLLEFHRSLVTNIEKVNSLTKLPLIIFVDADLAILQEFADFKSKAEERNVSLMLIVVESDVVFSTSLAKKQSKVPKVSAMPYLAGSSPYKTIDLRRELSSKEVTDLVPQLLKIESVSDDSKEKLRTFENRAKTDISLRKFALFSLVVFGRKFAGLKQYVEYRLKQANEIQIQILEHLALVHVFTDYRFPVNALSKSLKTNVVILESIFIKDDVRELLSPPLKDKNERRISFLEVAEEILKQRAQSMEISFPKYLKAVAVKVAETTLAVAQPSKLLDRITRRLYVTSEYSSENEKFSPLVRCIKEKEKDAARDMLLELCNVFDEDSSVWAHLKAHLAKYYMAIYEDFQSAIRSIEEALQDHDDDSLLHHIHGDIIRLHIRNLKDKKVFQMDDILCFAIKSSACFQIVREKRPLMEHGYISDALLRETVMLAALKSCGKENYVDYLNGVLEGVRQSENFEELDINHKYVLSLVPDAFEYLGAVPISQHTARLKKNLLKNIGNLDKLKAFCDDLNGVMKGSNNEHWIDEAVGKTTTLIYALEIETKDLKGVEIDQRIAKIEESSKNRFGEQNMILWLRWARQGSKVPNLKTVRSNIDSWLKATKGKSLNALFYNYVLAVLEALSDPKDTEKMDKAITCINQVHRKKIFFLKGNSEDPTMPLEWLHPKDGHHINSIDSLMHHDVLVNEFYKNGRSSANAEPMKARKEIIERALYEQSITQWDGVVSEIVNDWKGTICLKKHIKIPFVPVNVIPGMPSQGDTVKFCLAFQKNGPNAWSVFCRRDLANARKASYLTKTVVDQAEENDQFDANEEEEEEGSPDLLPLVDAPLHRQRLQTEHVSTGQKERWQHYLGSEKQGIVESVETKGYGRLRHPSVEDLLFFHAKQFFPPIDDITIVRKYSVLSFIVGKTESGLRANDIKILDKTKGAGIDQEILDHLKRHEEDILPTSKPEEQAERRQDNLLDTRQEGQVKHLAHDNGITWGTIDIEVPTQGNVQVFFHEIYSGINKNDVRKIKKGTKVQFTIGIREDGGMGYEAKKMYIQCESKNSCNCGWEEVLEKGIQEGFIAGLKKGCFGYIRESCEFSHKKDLFFHKSQLRNIEFSQLNIGDQVFFKVRTGETSCQAVDIYSSQIPQQSIQTPCYPQFRPEMMYVAPHTFNSYAPLRLPEQRLPQMSRAEPDPNIREGWQTVRGRSQKKN